MYTVIVPLAVIITTTFAMQQTDSVQYYCGRRTFMETEVSVSKDIKFITDVTGADSYHNVSLQTDPNSFKIDVTGCMVPKGVLIGAVGVQVQHEEIPKIHTGAIQNLAELKLIRIEHCGVEEVLPSAFFAVPSIETISLRFNNIVKITEGVFNKLNVTKLYLNNNSVSYIEQGALDNMPNLKVIELDSNKLKDWYTDWFSYTPNVEHLSLDSNQLTTLPANAFSKLRNYYSTVIRVSNNRIIFIHPTAFRGLTLLYALWLDNNKISKLDKEIFANFERLHILSLASNKLECLNEDLLYGLKSPDLILLIENNQFMGCECLRKIESWAESKGYFLTESYVENECDRKMKMLYKSVRGNSSVLSYK